MSDSANSPSTGINWEELKQRLSRAQQALTAAEQLSPEQAKAVMDERAAALARVPDPTPNTSQVLEVVAMRLGTEPLAIETRFVREVIRPEKLTPLPGGPDFLAGLTNLRGEVLAVINLAVLLEIGRDQISNRPQVLVLGDDRVEFGVIADAIEEVRLLGIDEILDTPGSVAGVSREYLRGVTKDALLVLDGETLLKDPRLYIDETDG